MLPSLRGCLQGTRSIAMIPFGVVGPYLRDKGKGERWSSAACAKFAGSATKDELGGYVKACKDGAVKPLCYVTVGPGDLLYIPTGYFMMEHVHNAGDVVGVKMQSVNFLEEFAQMVLQQASVDPAQSGNKLIGEALDLLSKHRAKMLDTYKSSAAKCLKDVEAEIRRQEEAKLNEEATKRAEEAAKRAEPAAGAQPRGPESEESGASVGVPTPPQQLEPAHGQSWSPLAAGALWMRPPQQQEPEGPKEKESERALAPEQPEDPEKKNEPGLEQPPEDPNRKPEPAPAPQQPERPKEPEPAPAPQQPEDPAKVSEAAPAPQQPVDPKTKVEPAPAPQQPKHPKEKNEPALAPQQHQELDAPPAGAEQEKAAETGDGGDGAEGGEDL